MVKRIIILFFIFIIQFIFAQSDSLTKEKNKFNPEFNSNNGFILKNFPNVPDENFVSLHSINICYQTKGGDLWLQFYNFPKIGVETSCGIFQSKEFGFLIGAVPNLVFKNRNNFYFKIGFGAAFFNKPYNLITNNRNLYIGSNFTNMTTFCFGRGFKIGEQLVFNLGLTYAHFSNGHTALPNVGMNSFLFNLGIEAQESKPKKNLPDLKLKNKLIYSVRASIGFHEFGATTKAVGGPTYPSYHCSFFVSKPFKNIHVVDFGFVASYYTSFQDYIVSQEVYKTNIKLKSSTGVVFVGHEFIFGKFGFSTQLGIYVYNPFFIQQKKIEGTWNSNSEKLAAINTNRLGLIYYPFKKKNSLNQIKNQFMLGMYIKANLGQADMFEYLIGYRF